MRQNNRLVRGQLRADNHLADGIRVHQKISLEHHPLIQPPAPDRQGMQPGHERRLARLVAHLQRLREEKLVRLLDRIDRRDEDADRPVDQAEAEDQEQDGGLVEPDKAFERRTISGLPMWLRPEFTLARVGPRTLAIGGEQEVAGLARVRLGIDPDLKITGPLLDALQSLKESSAIRLVSREPAKLDRMFAPVFNNEIENCDLFALSLTLQTPVKGRLILKAKSAEAAGDLAARIRNEPQRLLKLADSELLLYAQPPDVELQGTNVQLRFDVPENSARLLLQRLAKVTPAPAVAAE